MAKRRHVGNDRDRGAEVGSVAVLAALSMLATILATHSLLETARDALFLAGLPASRLPWVYLAVAALGLLVARTNLLHVSHARGLAWLLALSSLVCLGFWLLLWNTPADWMLYALYVWSGLFATLAIVQFWGIIERQTTITEAKKVFGLVGTGSIVGAIGGSAVARALTSVTDTRHLVLAAACSCLVAAFGVHRMARRGEGRVRSGSSESESLAAAFRRVRTHPYTRRVALIVLSATLAFTLLDFVFKSVVAREIAAERLGSFFATVNIALNVVSLFAQLLLARQLLTRTRLGTTIALVPALLVAGAIGVAVTGGLIAALALKGADGSLRHSLHRTATEVLYVPMSDRMRRSAKLLIDVVGQRGGQAVGSMAILVTLAIAGPSIREFAIVVVLLSAGWLALALALEPHYLDLFRRTLKEQSVQTRVDFPGLDLDSLESLFRALNGTDEEVLAALDLLSEEERGHLIPDLILYHPSRAVVLRAMELFEQERRTSFLPIAERLLRHEDPEIRAAVVRARLAVGADSEMLEEVRKDPSPVVRSTALIGRLLGADELPPDARDELGALRAAGGTEAELAMARAMRRRGCAAFVDLLLVLSRSESSEVRREVAEAMAEHPDARFIGALLPLLGERATRRAARNALVAIGDPALDALGEALEDDDLPVPVLHHVPRTISRFSPKKAAPVLLAHVGRASDVVVRHKLLRGLRGIRAAQPEVELDQEQVDRAVSSAITEALRTIHLRAVLEAEEDEPTAVSELLLSFVRAREADARERVFSILALRLPDEDIDHIHRGVVAPDRKLRASSRELLQSLLPAQLREGVLTVAFSQPEDGPREGNESFYNARPLDVAGAIQGLLHDPDESLRCVAVRRAGELGLVEHVASQRDAESPFLREAAEHAMQLRREEVLLAP